MSALEHAVPERFFNDPNQCNDYATPNPIAGLPDCSRGISAISAISIASTQGQKIYTITQKIQKNNPSIVNTALSAHSPSVRNNVQQALNTGYEVTIHERPISESGWIGAGYIKIDPTTGAGEYIIEGGGNGGFLRFLGALFLDPTLLRTPCGESFLKDTIDRFLASNSTIPGITLPTGATIITAGTVAKEIGGLTFFQFAQLSLRNPQFLLGNTAVLGITAIINNILMGLAFEIGLLIGSGISSAICKEE